VGGRAGEEVTSRYKILPQGLRDSMGAIAHAKFELRPFHVATDRLFTNPECLCCFAVLGTGLTPKRYQSGVGEQDQGCAEAIRARDQGIPADGCPDRRGVAGCDDQGRRVCPLACDAGKKEFNGKCVAAALCDAANAITLANAKIDVVSAQSINAQVFCSLLVPRNAEAWSGRWIDSPGYVDLELRFVQRP
jgi:hypothetical protein